MKPTYPTRSQLLPCLLALLLSSCAYAPWQKDGVSGATPDERVDNARSAKQQNPEAISPLKDVHTTREQATYELLADAERARNEGRKEDAAAIYGRVLAINPNNPRAMAGQMTLKREQEHTAKVSEASNLFAEGKPDAALARLHQVLLEEPSYAGALALQADIRRKQPDTIRNEPPRLKPPFDNPVTLELRDANIKMVFESLSRTTGINFILDKDIKQDAKATVYIKRSSIENAIEMVLATNGLQKKVLSETNVLVFPNTAQKLKDYQDLVIRSFYLTNANSKQVAALLKSMLKIKDVHVDERLNMLVVRDTPEVIRIAEKLVSANDMADPEVMLEVEVLEVSRSRLQELGIQYPGQVSIAGATESATSITLEALRNVNSSQINVLPLPAINFRKDTDDVSVLANPRIRVRNNEKAKVLIGDKVPVITTTATAGVGSSETVQYIDVGLKLEVEPRIALDDHVNIKVMLEVSSLGVKTTLTNGSSVYQIGTRNASTILRLKDGETQVLAGLISEVERNSANKLPGFGDIPLLGRLFTNQSDNKIKTEIVLAITPRVLNNLRRPESEIIEYWSGTESGITDRAQMAAPVGGLGVVGAMRGLPSPQLPASATEPQQERPADEPAKENPAPAEAAQVSPLAKPVNEQPSVQ